MCASGATSVHPDSVQSTLQVHWPINNKLSTASYMTYWSFLAMFHNISYHKFPSKSMVELL